MSETIEPKRWILPDNLIPPYFIRELSDKSVLIGFQGSRFHSHIFKHGDKANCIITENAPGGEKPRTQSIEEDWVRIEHLFLQSKKSEILLPDNTEAILLDIRSLDGIFRAILEKQEGTDEILKLFKAINENPPDAISKALVALRKLVELEHRVGGILTRCSLLDARRRYGMNFPCYVIDGNTLIFGQITEKGILHYSEEPYFQLLPLLIKLSRAEELFTLPVKTGNQVIIMKEEIMDQLEERYENTIHESKKID